MLIFGSNKCAPFFPNQALKFISRFAITMNLLKQMSMIRFSARTVLSNVA